MRIPARLIANETLDQSVFQRVETDHHQPPSRRQRIQSDRQGTFQLAQLVIQMDANGLEDPRSGVLALFPGGMRRLDDLGELMGPFDRSLATGRDDGPGDSLGETLFPVGLEDARHFLIVGARDPSGSANARGRIHAHVQRAIP